MLTHGGNLRPRPLDLVGRFERRRGEFAGLLTGQRVWLQVSTLGALDPGGGHSNLLLGGVPPGELLHVYCMVAV